ncbi:Uma2 family endonuclease [Spirulina sp. 06S082]|uniref:Uma2 family endonuclease n=1 Tax=Spirulina sp. 06S082 TaxID=3110248 RepID=UPI002B1EBB97|nr:Uma2 family endonuclease [Spirulina sp. 06S082]MEA5468169.1 Uma2 family endonuclease [Spirulina sp. 06S082]
MVVAYPISKKLTLEDFLQLPETKPSSEYFGGEIIQKPMPQGEHSTIQLELASAINKIGKTAKLVCSWPELRCTFGDRSIVPDIAVFEWERIPKKENGRIANKFTIHPDWIIEILSPEQSTTKVINKILFCLQQGTKLAWLIDSEEESVMIFLPDRTLEIKTGDDILPVLDCLKDWELSAKEMFSWLIF